MIRIFLPLAVIAVLLFAPIFNDKVDGSELGSGVVSLSGSDYVQSTIDCWLNQKFSLDGECAPEGGLKGKAIFFAIFVSAVAAVLGVAGLLPFIGRATSFVTTLAGVVVIGAVGFYILQQMSADEGVGGLQWGSYLAGGGGLLTLVAGLSGIRGK